jgi:pimeloyl-ACP methyl ester carboxylesterase
VLAGAGYRAVAMDVRGYGRSSAPPDIESYRMLRMVADNVALVHALGETTATVVGHDWGRADRVDVGVAASGRVHRRGRAVGPVRGVGPDAPVGRVPCDGRRRGVLHRVLPAAGACGGELDADVRRWLLGFYFSASGDASSKFVGRGSVATIPRGAQMRDRFVYPDEGTMPSWMSDEDLDVYTAEFERTGFTGGLNRYRNVDRDWEDLQVLAGAPDRGARRCSSAATATARRCGAARRSSASRRRCRGCTARSSCPGAGTGRSRSAREVNEALLDFLAATR